MMETEEEFQTRIGMEGQNAMREPVEEEKNIFAPMEEEKNMSALAEEEKNIFAYVEKIREVSVFNCNRMSSETIQKRVGKGITRS